MIGLLLDKAEYKAVFDKFNDFESIDISSFAINLLEDYDCVFAHESDIKNFQAEIEIYYKNNLEKCLVLFSGGFSKSDFIIYRNRKLTNCLKINFELLKASLTDFIDYYSNENTVNLRVLLGGYTSFLRNLRDCFLNFYLSDYMNNFAQNPGEFSELSLISNEFKHIKTEINDFILSPTQGKFITVRDKMNELIFKRLLSNAE